MPELPEVETIRRGIAPHLCGRRVTQVVVRRDRLRWPLPAGLADLLTGRRVRAVERRGKYLLLRFTHGTLLLHLGMSGTLRLLPAHHPAGRHDHFDLVVAGGEALRLTDPRRFGALLWQPGPDPARHPRLRTLGPEPLGPDFTGTALHARSRGRRVAVKPFLMDGSVVVGVGNIYACESLFRAGIHPARAAGRISLQRYRRLTAAVRTVLEEAIDRGGTTLRDFTDSEGRPGYFAQRLTVYGREGMPCPECGTPVCHRRLGGRSSYYCPRCQH